MKGILKRLWQEEEGQDLVEYGLLLVLAERPAGAATNQKGHSEQSATDEDEPSLAAEKDAPIEPSPER